MTQPREHTCTCGKMRWRIADAAKGSHLICYCEDCQTYANALENGVRRIDTDGGTEIFQTLPKNFEFVEGKEHLAAMRLGPKGIVRWYAGCCDTPIANTLPTAKLPFVGAVLPPGTDGYGPITALLSTVDTKSDIKDKGVLGAQVSAIVRVLLGSLTKKSRQTPFFKDDKTPAVEPRVLTKEQRNAARP